MKPVGDGVVWFRKVMMKESKGSEGPEDIVTRRTGRCRVTSRRRCAGEGGQGGRDAEGLEVSWWEWW